MFVIAATVMHLLRQPDESQQTYDDQFYLNDFLDESHRVSHPNKYVS
jgi:cytochrome P450